MRTTVKVLAVTAIVVTSLSIYTLVRWNRHSRKRLKKVSNEGYETALDVLYPEKLTRGKLHYGPVLPA